MVVKVRPGVERNSACRLITYVWVEGEGEGGGGGNLTWKLEAVVTALTRSLKEVGTSALRVTAILSSRCCTASTHQSTDRTPRPDGNVRGNSGTAGSVALETPRYVQQKSPMATRFAPALPSKVGRGGGGGRGRLVAWQTMRNRNPA